MKIIQATIQPPDLRSGGGLGVYQSSYSLLENNLVYIGPELKEPGIERMYDSFHYLDRGRTKAAKGLSFVATGLFHSWRGSASLIREVRPSCCYLDFTWAYPFAEAVKDSGLPLVVRAHNVEADYADRQYATSKNLRNRISVSHARPCELRVLKCADVLVCLTEHDKERFISLYGAEVPGLQGKIRINPVCIQEKDVDELTVATLGDPPTLLVTGSLWNGTNADGVVWFVREVWPKLGKGLRLIVAGARPSNEVREVCGGDERIELVDSPTSMAPYFQKADFLVAPVFDGAGMKVKVAEALSYGMPVVATSHSLIGYVEGADCLRQADTPEEMADQISLLLEQDYAALRESAIDVFKRHYSLQSSRHRIQQIVSEVCDGR